MNFVKAHSGYTVDAVAKSGRIFRIKVRKEESMNPSARGGAYMTEWVAKFGLTKGRGKTRTEAVEALVQRLAVDGVHVTID